VSALAAEDDDDVDDGSAALSVAAAPLAGTAVPFSRVGEMLVRDLDAGLEPDFTSMTPPTIAWSKSEAAPLGAPKRSSADCIQPNVGGVVDVKSGSAVLNSNARAAAM
jgi:hypothetical protein